MASFAVCTVARDEAPFIEEWIAFHLVIGAALVRIYVDQRGTDDTAALVARAGRAEAVECLPWQPLGRFEAAQCAAYAHAARGLAGRVDWAAFIDADHFLFAEGGVLGDALDAFGPDVGAIAVGSRQFGSSGRAAPGPGLVIERFTRCAPAFHPSRGWYNTVARPASVLDFDSSHSARLLRGRTRRADGRPLDRSDDAAGRARTPIGGPLVLHHYGLKSRQEFAAKLLRWQGAEVAGRRGPDDFDRIDGWASQQDCTALLPLVPAVRAMITHLRGTPS